MHIANPITLGTLNSRDVTVVDEQDKELFKGLFCECENFIKENEN